MYFENFIEKNTNNKTDNGDGNDDGNGDNVDDSDYIVIDNDDNVLAMMM